MTYEKRVYRYYSNPDDLKSFEVKIQQTDFLVLADEDLSDKTEELIIKYRGQIESYIIRDKKFAATLKPYDAAADAPQIVRDMAIAAKKAGVGPMAAVAGAISEYVGNGLLEYSSQVIIENGGDIFIKSNKTRKIGLHTGNEKIDRKLILEIEPSENPHGMCTSSGKIGPSLSFGQADAVAILSRSVPVADAVATATGNIVKSADDIQKGIDFARSVEGVRGVMIVINGSIGIWGNMKLLHK